MGWGGRGQAEAEWGACPSVRVTPAWRARGHQESGHLAGSFEWRGAVALLGQLLGPAGNGDGQEVVLDKILQK